MSFMGTAFSRGLAGAGTGASEIANKYIDEGIAEQRAQVLADISRNSAVTQAGQMNDIANDPTRRAAARDQATADTVAAGAATDQSTLNRDQNLPLTQAGIAKSNLETAGTSATKAAAAGATKLAETNSTAHEVAPGGQVIIGAGSNSRMTPAEASLQEYQAGLRGKTGEQRQRAYEELLKSHDTMLKDVSKRIDDGVTAGTLHTTQDTDSHMFGADTPKKDPAYDAYQRMLIEQRSLAKARDDIVRQWKEESNIGTGKGGGAAAPARPAALSGLDKDLGGGKPAGSAAAPAGAPTPMQADGRRVAGDMSGTPEADAVAGKLMVVNEYGGDVGKAKAALDEMDQSLKADKGAPMEARGALRAQRARLAAGIDAMGGVSVTPIGASSGESTPGDGTMTPTSTAQPADVPLPAPGSLMAKAQANQGRGSVSPAMPTEAPQNEGSAKAVLAAIDAKSTPAKVGRAVDSAVQTFKSGQADADKVRSEFNADLGTMSPQALVAKYKDVRDMLSLMQNGQLMRLMRGK